MTLEKSPLTLTVSRMVTAIDLALSATLGNGALPHAHRGRFKQLVRAAQKIARRSLQSAGRVAGFEAPVAMLAHHVPAQILHAHLQASTTGWALLHEVG